MRTGDGAGPDTPIGVVSAVITDEARPGHILLGVRRASPLAPRHPGVLSTPTMRLSPDTFQPLTQAFPDTAGKVGLRAVAGPAVDIGRYALTTALGSLVLECLLMRKLGLAETLVDLRLHGCAHPRYLALDEVADPLGTGRSEWTAMLTYEVRLHGGAEAVPYSTGSYSRLVWVPAAKVPLALAHHDALLLDETLDAAEVCVQGLCVRVAAQLVTDGVPRESRAAGVNLRSRTTG
jgi:hypothetical protein